MIHEPTHTVYALIRTDLALADQIVQIGHACWEAGRRCGAAGSAPRLVVLEVPTQPALSDALEELRLAGIVATAFVEPDRGLGLTAACTEPVSAPRRFLRRGRLWRPES